MEKRQVRSTTPTGARSRRDRRKVFVAAVAVIAVVALAACGSGTGTTKGTSAPTTPPTTGANAPVVKTLGVGVTADTIKLGVALVDFKAIKQFTDTIRTNAEQKQIYKIYIDDINAKGGIAGRKIVPVYKFYAPLGTAQIVPLCTTFAQDDNVFAVVGTFIDFSGDADLHRETAAAHPHDVQPDAGDHRQVAARARDHGRPHPRAVRVDPARARTEAGHAQGQDGRRPR